MFVQKKSSTVANIPHKFKVIYLVPTLKNQGFYKFKHLGYIRMFLKIVKKYHNNLSGERGLVISYCYNVKVRDLV